MKRPLFVFAGQSNMMGACVFEASEQIYYKNSFEYLHKPLRMGKEMGEFKTFGFPVGEFSYKDLNLAYSKMDPEQKSELDVYRENTFFCPSMCNLDSEEEKTVHPFSYFSEANNRKAVSLAPFVVKELEDRERVCAYTHITKGGMPISYFVDDEAAEYFDLKVKDFFADSEKQFASDDTSERVLVWLQGEADAKYGYDHYCTYLKKLWERTLDLGFTRFFIVRVGYFGNEAIGDIMKAQEDFCNATENAYIITRVCSFLEWAKPKKGWLTRVDDEFNFCRDSFYGFNNNHVNEKGFKVIAKYATPNMVRVLFENKEPILEEERVSVLL